MAIKGRVRGGFDPAADMPMYRPGFDWFVLRVASNKESGVRETLLRKVQIEGMEHLVGRIMVPTEKTQSIKGGVSKERLEVLVDHLFNFHDQRCAVVV